MLGSDLVTEINQDPDLTTEFRSSSHGSQTDRVWREEFHRLHPQADPWFDLSLKHTQHAVNQICLVAVVLMCIYSTFIMFS